MTEKKTKVLIVDDNMDFCEILNDFLGSQPDIQVSGIAYNGYSALDMILHKELDIVLLDLLMPGLDGLGVLREVKGHTSKHGPVYIVVTTEGMENIVKSAMSLGASAFITKPMSLDHILGSIRSFIVS